MKKILTWMLVALLMFASLPLQKAQAVAFDPETKTEGSKTLDLRFWEDQKPDIGFYINAANRYILETVTAPQMGSTFGEWSVMDLLRASYTGYDYLNYIPENYYNDYLDRINEYVISKGGKLDASKSTEWSRLTLTMSSLGKDIRAIGKPGQYIKTKEAMPDGNGGYKFTSNSQSQGLGVVEIQNKQFILDEAAGVFFEFTNRFNKPQSIYQIIPSGKYTLNDDNTITNEAGEQVAITYEEIVSKKLYGTHNLTTIPDTGFVLLEKPYDFAEELSKSFKFSYRQGINGPIWELIAMDTAGYDLYSAQEMESRGIIPAINDIYNTKGLMIDFILKKEITDPSKNDRLGGWALTGNKADPDITMMAVQGLAPYYLSEEKFKRAYAETRALEYNKSNTPIISTDAPYYDVESESFKQKYIEFKKAVERAVVAMSEDIQPNGAFNSWGNVNAESTVQVLVALNALNMDPLAKSIHLPTLDKNVTFVTKGGDWDGVWSNNMVDAIIAHWAMGSSINGHPEVSGFKHVTTGNDGGGGSGTSVNAMATDQATYGLISQHRFENGQKSLYDMTDMINGEYKNMKAVTHTLSYKVGEEEFKKESFSPYAVVTIPEPKPKKGYRGYWTTKSDGQGASYKPGDKLSTPEHDITLYAQYEMIPYDVTYELNGATFATDNRGVYVEDKRALNLPTSDDLSYENQLFMGWYSNASFTGELLTVVSDPEITEITVYAKWKHFDELVKEATAAISQIPDEKALTLNDRSQVEAARIAYDLIPTTHQKSVADVDVLVRAEDVLKILNVTALIDSLSVDVKLHDEEQINQVANAFNALSAQLQTEVKNEQKLNEAKKLLKDLQQQVIDREAVKPVLALIEQLPSTIQIQDAAQINEALLAFENLTNRQQNYIELEATKLMQANEHLQKLLSAQSLQAIKESIEKLPPLDKVDISHKTQILSALAQYNSLSVIEKKKIDESALNAAVAKYIDVLIAKLPATLSKKDGATLTEIDLLYMDVNKDIQKLVKKLELFKQKMAQYNDLPKIEKANAVIEKINAIPAVVTTNAKATIAAARIAYDALVSEEKAYVTNSTKLIQAEITLQQAEANETVQVNIITTQIATLPATITLADKELVLDIYNQYYILPNSVKGKISNAGKLITAYNKISSLESQSNTVVQAIQASINALPTTVTLQHKTIIEDIIEKIKTLTTEQQARIKTTKLLEAQQQITKLEKEQAEKEQTDKPSDLPSSDEQEISLIESSENSLTAIVKQDEIASLKDKTFKLAASNGIAIEIPKDFVQQLKSDIQVNTTKTKIQNKQAFTIQLFKGTKEKSEKIDLTSPISIKIPKSFFLGKTASLATVDEPNGVILGYTEQNGFEAVRYKYDSGSYVVTVNKELTLVYSTEIVTFNDIQQHSSRNEIEALASRYIIKGYNVDSFRPNEKITRAQFASMINRALGLTSESDTKFEDIGKSEHKDSIQALFEAGIMTGTSKTTFSPNATLSRQHAAVVMQRVFEYLDVEVKSSVVHFTDKEKINKNYLKAIGILNVLNIMTGRPDGTFGPNDALTRGQLAKILQRTLVKADVLQ